MQTPGHAMINVAVLGTALGADLAPAMVAGAVLPDVPIMILYLRERILRGTPEETIWSDHYQRPFWRAAIHGAHSIPLSLLGAAGSYALGAEAPAIAFLSALLHALGDFPVHVHDAHRHFLPFSEWRFISPISYWDVRYHAAKVALVEAILATLAGLSIWTWTESPITHTAIALVIAWYAGHYWRSFGRRRGAGPHPIA